MKKVYQKPVTKSILVKIESLMTIVSGTEAKSGQAAMSRESNWSDED